MSHEKLHGKIYLYEQQDAQEFFQHIMQLLEDEQKSNKDLEQTTGLWSSKDQANGIIFDATEDFSYLSKKNPFLGTFESEFLCTNCNRNVSFLLYSVIFFFLEAIIYIKCIVFKEVIY